MIKSPLRYPGGKSRAIGTISQILPSFDEFREPFVGGGSVFVYLKQLFPKKKFWVNDLYFELFKFWEMSQKNTAGLIQKIQEWRTTYSEGKDLYQFLNTHLDTFDDIERATAFFIYNRITFSGTSLSGGYSEAEVHLIDIVLDAYADVEVHSLGTLAIRGGDGGLDLLCGGEVEVGIGHRTIPR